MPLTITKTDGEPKKLRRTPWPFQQTFATPLKDLPRFATAVLGGLENCRGASVHITQLVFEPKALNALIAASDDAVPIAEGISIHANEPAEVAPLLEACLACWIDFFFVPAPKPFIIFADHDEFTTLLSITKSGLNTGAQPLLRAGFRQTADYTRKL